MIGPHYQKIAEVQNKLNARQLLQKIQSRSQSNPLNQIVDKLRRQFSEYQTAYSDEIIDHQIHSVDRLLSFDGKLGPILNGLQKENNLLRKELSVLQNQLSNTVSICEQILNENNELKEIIKRKNMDLQKIIDTIALNQSQQRGSLQDKISLMQQENSILIRHLQQIRKQHQSYNQKFSISQQQTTNWKRKFEQTKRHLTQVLEQEQDLSRKLSLVEHNLYSQTQTVYNLEAQVQALTFDNNQMKNQLIVLKSDHKANTFDSLKTKLQQQYASILEEHKSLKKDKSELLREAESAKISRDDALDKLATMQKVVMKVQKDLDLTQTLLSEQKQKNASLQSNISRMQIHFDQMKGENNKLKLELESTNNYAVNKQKNMNREISVLREELDKKSLDMQRGLKDLRDKTRNLMEAKESEMKSLNETNLELRKLLDRQQNYGR